MSTVKVLRETAIAILARTAHEALRSCDAYIDGNHDGLSWDALDFNSRCRMIERVTAVLDGSKANDPDALDFLIASIAAGLDDRLGLCQDAIDANRANTAVVPDRPN